MLQLMFFAWDLKRSRNVELFPDHTLNQNQRSARFVRKRCVAHSSVWSHIQHALPDTEAEEEIQQLNPAFMELGARVVS